MKIIDVAVKKLYRFNCPNCGSKLEAEIHELADIGNKVSASYCPICRKERYISWSLLRKKTIYSDDEKR